MESIPYLTILTIYSRGRLSFPSLSKNLQRNKHVFPAELPFQIIVSSAGSCLVQLMKGLFPISFVLKRGIPGMSLVDEWFISNFSSKGSFLKSIYNLSPVGLPDQSLMFVSPPSLKISSSIKNWWWRCLFPSPMEQNVIFPLCRVSSPAYRRECFDWCTSDWWLFLMEFHITP